MCRCLLSMVSTNCHKHYGFMQDEIKGLKDEIRETNQYVDQLHTYVDTLKDQVAGSKTGG